jgi:hypothetical protein
MAVNKINYKGTEFEIVEDSGWITAELTDKFTVGALASDVVLQYRKVGNVVEINGVTSPTADIDTNNEHTIFTLPEDYRPSRIRYFHCQGAGMNTCLIIIRPGGSVTLSRYGTTSKSTMTSSGIAFLQATFLVD